MKSENHPEEVQKLFGWVGAILHVDLSRSEIRTHASRPYVDKYIGGRILASRLAWEWIPDKTGPFEPENVIIIATGPLTGTVAPTSGRTFMSMISPAPHPFPWYSHSTFGGWFGAQLKYAGYDALLISGCAQEKVYIKIIDQQVEIVESRQLWGHDAIETQNILIRSISPNAQVLAIGPAGENLVRMSTV